MNYSNNSATDPINFLYALEKDGIERQEAHEQTKLINSCDLPKKCDDWAKLESWGIIKGEETDPLFLSVTLPEGWKKVATDHSMWSHLVDDKGLIRAAIFYKGAFYDRSAHTHVTSNRYYATVDYSDENALAYEVRDAVTKTTVQQFPASYWGYIVPNHTFLGIAEKKVVGLIHGDRFYFNPDKYARFSESCEASLATKITLDEFYKDFHHVTSCHDEMEAAEFLAKQDAVALTTKLNQESEW